MIKGGIRWLEPVDAIALIRSAKAQGTKLLGFDAAFVDASSTRPSLEDGWDYTSNSYPSVSDPYGHATQFIRERATKGLCFEIVLDERSNPQS